MRSTLLLLAALVLVGHLYGAANASRVSLPESLADRFFSKLGGEETVADAEQCGPKLSIETPSCELVEDNKGFELRLYPEGQIWVETLVADSSFLYATTTGFYRCFNFISGQNEKKESIEMTGPVLIKPVSERGGFSISFFAPSRFRSAADVPKPTNPLVKIVETKETLKAVLKTFGGFPDNQAYKEHWEVLKEYCDKANIEYDESTVVYAGYSSPFEIFNRKQEVMVTVTHRHHSTG